VALGRYLEGPGKSNNPFVIERIEIPGTYFKISSTDHQAFGACRSDRNQILFTTSLEITFARGNRLILYYYTGGLEIHVKNQYIVGDDE
jgi:hypothetical protein